MSFPRLIAAITLIGDQAVKTKKFKSQKYIGDPVNTTALLSSFEVEELVVLDISKSFMAVPTDNGTLSRIIENAFMPIAFGGGINSMARAQELFSIGFDKIILKTELLSSFLPQEIAREFGSQAVSGCLDVKFDKKDPDCAWINGQPVLRSEMPTIVERIIQAKVGEVFVQDIDRDGTREGFLNNWVLSEVLANLEIPVVPIGGCKDLMDAATFLNQVNCHSIAASSIFLFSSKRDGILINYPDIDLWHKLLAETRNE